MDKVTATQVNARVDVFADLWEKRMAMWAEHGEWRQGLEKKMARVLNGLLPTTENADDIVLEIEALEEQQQAFSSAIHGAEMNALGHVGEMTDCKERMNVVEARLVLDCTESNAAKRKAELTIAQSKDEEWTAARKAFREAEHNKLAGEARQKELERDRSRIAGQVWSRRSRLDLLAARLNAVMKNGETSK